MSSREYFKLGIAELEDLFEKSKDNKKILNKIKNELKHRTRPRAKKLLIKVEQTLSKQWISLPIVPPEPAVPVRPEPAPSHPPIAVPQENPKLKKKHFIIALWERLILK